LRLSESRFHAIVSNTPGLVYQFRLAKNGTTSFPYLSDGCQALLGIPPERLRSQPDMFIQLILPEDRQSYIESMRSSAADCSSWNWEGRIWIEEWKDIKWINLRCTPRLLIGDEIQWEGIMTNITQSKLAEEEIKKSRAQLAELSAHDEKVKEQERTRIAREIHDDLGGNLTAIKMALALLQRRLPEGDEGLIEKATYVDSLVDRTIESVHRIAGDLRPSILDFGLVAAIKWQINEFEKQVGIPCEFSSNKDEIDLHLDQATALFRIFQEALTNISKHAKATRVSVKLTRSNRNVRLEISDNGKGFTSKDRLKSKSFGIRGMIERASGLGGSLTVNTKPEGGCLVAIKIPLLAT
jgi:signal transduction histidine kinase